MTEWRKNPGYCPDDLVDSGARVFVRLNNGREPQEPWPVDGRQGLCWSRRNSDFDVAEFRKA